MTGTTGITVTPVHNGTAPTQAAANGVFAPVGHGAAHLIPVSQKPAPHGKIGLWSVANGSELEVRTHKIKDLKKTSVMKKCNDVWEKTRAFVQTRDAHADENTIETRPNPDATNHDKNIKREIVTISYVDSTTGEKRYISQRDIPQEILVKMDKIREMVRPNMTFGAQAPLQIAHKKFQPPKSLDEYLEKEFPELEASLDPAKKANALKNLLTSEALIQGFKTHLRAIIDERQADLDDQVKTPSVPCPPRKKKEEELRKLKHILEQFDAIDRRAVFRAVATWDNTKTGPIDNDVRIKLHTAADTVTLGGEKAFKDKERARQDAHYFRDSKIGRKLGLFKPMDPKETRGYNLDMGDLLLPDRWDAQGRRTDSERSDTRSSVEQLVVQMMMDLNSVAPGTPLEHHPILEDLDVDTRQTVLDTIQAPLPSPAPNQAPQYYPLAYAKAVYQHLTSTPAVGNTNGDLQARLTEARRTANPNERYDSCIPVK
jgi:hypothetical protein